MNTLSNLSHTTLALRDARLDGSGWPAAPVAAGAGAGTPPSVLTDTARDTAGRQAAAWFNQPLADASQVLYAPTHVQGGDAQALCQRFLASLAHAV